MLSLRALLSDEPLELTLVVPGLDDALDRRVLWFHNTELADPSPYIRESEAVLTNGLWLKDVSAQSFVAALVRAQAAGLVFGLTAQNPRVPSAVIEACAEADVPLLTLSVSVPFTAVTEAAARIHSAGRQDALVGMVRRGDALAASLSRGGGAAGVLHVLRRDHDLPLSVVDRAGRELATAGATLTPAQLESVAEVLAMTSPPREVELPDIGTVPLFLVKERSAAPTPGCSVSSRPNASTYATARRWSRPPDSSVSRSPSNKRSRRSKRASPVSCSR